MTDLIMEHRAKIFPSVLIMLDVAAAIYMYDGDIRKTIYKPVALYKWLLWEYAKGNDKILDTHLGSGSIAIACHDDQYDLTGYELDTEYYEAACKRLEKHQKQLTFDLT